MSQGFLYRAGLNRGCQKVEKQLNPECGGDNQLPSVLDAGHPSSILLDLKHDLLDYDPGLCNRIHACYHLINTSFSPISNIDLFQSCYKLVSNLLKPVSNHIQTCFKLMT